MSTTQKETIEYDTSALDRWNHFCDSKGYVKRQASHAARIAFMQCTAEQREQIMREAMQQIAKKRGGK